jgi:hypothetical protein
MTTDGKRKKKKNNATFGWEVFNDDSLFRGYEKRVKKLPGADMLAEMSKEEKLELLVGDLNK